MVDLSPIHHNDIKYMISPAGGTRGAHGPVGQRQGPRVGKRWACRRIALPSTDETARRRCVDIAERQKLLICSSITRGGFI